MGLRYNRRLGKFQISWTLINDYPQAVCAILKDVIVLRTTELHEYDAIEYIGLHADFAEVPFGSTPLQYQPLFSQEIVEGETVATFHQWEQIT